MIDITKVDRSMTREQWAHFYAILRTHGEQPRREPDYNAAIAARVAECAEDGRVAVNYSGMDCDCSQFAGSYLMPAVPVAVRHYIADAQHWADGPIYHSISRPSERAPSYSRDLALEAFEDGRPFSIHV